MRDIVALLRELQELEITLREARILHGEDSGDVELETQIQALRGRIAVDALARYDRLSRHGLGVVPLMNEMCMGCNMSIPRGDLNRMKANKLELICPNCGRYLIF